MDMTDLLNDFYKRGEPVSIYVSGLQRAGSSNIAGVVSDVTTDLVEIISPYGETFYVRQGSINLVVIAP